MATSHLDARDRGPYTGLPIVRTAIVIPARLGATRLPNKPLLALGNVPVVVRVMRQARKVPGIVDVVVATDVEAIAVVVREYGGDAMLTNPDHQSGTDRVAEVALARGYDRVINLQGDEPFIDPRDLSAIAEALAKPGCDIATLKRPILSREETLNPSVVKVVTRDDGEAMYFSRAPIPYDRSGKNDLTQSFRHIGVYGYNRAALERMTREAVHPLEKCEGLEQLRALALGLRITVIPALSIGHGIDTEADLAWAREHVARFGEAAFPEGTMSSAITDPAGALP